MPPETEQVFTELADSTWAALTTWIDANPLLATIAIGAALLLVAWLAQAVTRRYLIGLIGRLAKRNRAHWDDALFGRSVLTRLSRAVPLIIIRAGLPLLPLLPAGLADFIQRLLSAVIIFVVVWALAAAIDAFGDIYEKHPRSRERPIKSYLQGLTIVLYAMAGIAALAGLLNRDPLLILSGFGAASAILLLVFQDTILSLVAGAQLTTNDLLRVGDWIEMPTFNADGDVVEIALNNVKIENWDKTFTVIPAHLFLKNSFKNYRTMYQTGRRIMRSILIDQDSVRFLSADEVAALGRFAILRPYLQAKEEALAEWNSTPERADHAVNSRRLTNLGTFRAYVEAYLRADERINKDLLFAVRQLAPTPDGLPLQLYVFTVETGFVSFEATQADIFDHLLAIIHEFDLRLAQRPLGADFRSGQGAVGPALDSQRS